VLASVGGRTTAGGLEQLARNLFRDGGACAILVVESPRGTSGPGLDGTVSMVDRDVVVVNPNLPERVRSWTVRPRRIRAIRTAWKWWPTHLPGRSAGSPGT